MDDNVQLHQAKREASNADVQANQRRKGGFTLISHKVLSFDSSH